MPAGPEPVDVADQTIQLVCDFSQVMIDPPTIFGQLTQIFGVFPKQAGLALLDLGNHDQIVLKRLDCLPVVHVKYGATATYIFS
jgi:hypothetical protein